MRVEAKGSRSQRQARRQVRRQVLSSMRRPFWSLALVLGLLLVSVFVLSLFWSDNSQVQIRERRRNSVANEPVERLQGEESRVDQKTAIHAESAAPAIASRDDSSESAPAKPLKIRDLVPLMSEVRNQAIQDSHQTPAAMLEFSVLMGRRVLAAAATDKGSQQMFAELRDCVLHPREPELRAPQVMCLLNAQILSKKHLELKESFAQLEMGADAEVQKNAKSLYRN